MRFVTQNGTLIMPELVCNPVEGFADMLSHRVLLKSFCRSHLPHKSVNVFFISENVKDQLTDSTGLRPNRGQQTIILKLTDYS